MKSAKHLHIMIIQTILVFKFGVTLSSSRVPLVENLWSRRDMSSKYLHKICKKEEEKKSSQKLLIDNRDRENKDSILFTVLSALRLADKNADKTVFNCKERVET